MRMWNVKPNIMCRQHLLGEHLECHMFLGTHLSGKSLKGYIQKGLLEIHNIQKRHNELVHEMMRRGYHHESPMGRHHLYIPEAGYVDIEANMKELASRCKECAELQRHGGYDYNQVDAVSHV